MREVRVLGHAFSPTTMLEDFSRLHGGAGGIASFLGQVRAGTAQALELLHYEPLTLPGMEALADQALERFSLHGVLAIHRTGHLSPGEPIVLVAAAAPHRREALQAVDFLMDHLKSAAWFWKRELRADGWHWIEPRKQDISDIARWA